MTLQRAAFALTLIAGGAIAGLLAGTGSVSAATIQGDVGIGGSALINATTKSVTVVGNAGHVLPPGGSGNLASMQTGELVNFANFMYGPAFVPLTIWSSPTDGFAFFLQSLSDDLDPRGNILAVQGAGLLTKLGFDDTPANFTFSANIAGGTAEWRFSADGAVVPLPGALPLFLGALAGLGLIGRRPDQG